MIDLYIALSTASFLLLVYGVTFLVTRKARKRKKNINSKHGLIDSWLG